MNPRDKHLLEVFRDLGEAEARPPAAPATPGSPVEPPRVGPDASEPAPAPRRASLPRPPEGARLSSPGRLGLFFAAAVVVALLVGYFFGRGDGSGEPVQAADAQDDPLAFLEGSGESPAAAGPGAGGSSVDSAQVFAQMAELLADDSNKYTVVAITYDNNENNERLAWSTVYHFAERGLPVGPPYGRGGLLYILVGAAPVGSELNPLRDRVRVQIDPGGRRSQYESAYVSRIDQVISDR